MIIEGGTHIPLPRKTATWRNGVTYFSPNPPLPKIFTILLKVKLTKLFHVTLSRLQP